MNDIPEFSAPSSKDPSLSSQKSANEQTQVRATLLNNSSSIPALNQSTPANIILQGEVISERSEPTTRIVTPQGELELRTNSAAQRPQKGQRVEIEIPPSQNARSERTAHAQALEQRSSQNNAPRQNERPGASSPQEISSSQTPKTESSSSQVSTASASSSSTSPREVIIRNAETRQNTQSVEERHASARELRATQQNTPSVNVSTSRDNDSNARATGPRSEITPVSLEVSQATTARNQNAPHSQPTQHSTQEFLEITSQQVIKLLPLSLSRIDAISQNAQEVLSSRLLNLSFALGSHSLSSSLALSAEAEPLNKNTPAQSFLSSSLSTLSADKQNSQFTSGFFQFSATTNGFFTNTSSAPSAFESANPQRNIPILSSFLNRFKSDAEIFSSLPLSSFQGKALELLSPQTQPFLASSENNITLGVNSSLFSQKNLDTNTANRLIAFLENGLVISELGASPLQNVTSLSFSGQSLHEKGHGLLELLKEKQQDTSPFLSRISNISTSSTRVIAAEKINALEAQITESLEHASPKSILTQGASFQQGQVIGFIDGSFPVIYLPFSQADNAALFVLPHAVSLSVGSLVNIQFPLEGASLQVSTNTIPSSGAAISPVPATLLTPETWPVLQELLQQVTSLSAETAQNMQNVMPNAAKPAQLGAAAMFFLAAIRAGDINGWLGDKTTSLLKKEGRSSLLSRIGQESSLLSRLISEPVSQDWRAVSLPMVYQEDVQKISLFYKQENTSDNDAHHKEQKTRFILNLNLSNIGELQIDGLARSSHLDLVIRTKNPFSKAMQMQMKQLYISTIENEGFTGELGFQSNPKQWVHIQIKKDLFKSDI